MINWIKESDEVFYYKEQIPKISNIEIKFLVNQANNSQRKTCRLCMHKNIQEKSHEMFIAHLFDCYDRPHMHLNKIESMTVIEGEADAFFFSDSGKILNKIELGNYSSGKKFYYRIDKGIYHSLLIRTDYFIFQETTTGPFYKDDLVYPSWSPEISNKLFLDKLKNYQ